MEQEYFINRFKTKEQEEMEKQIPIPFYRLPFKKKVEIIYTTVTILSIVMTGVFCLVYEMVKTFKYSALREKIIDFLASAMEVSLITFFVLALLATSIFKVTAIRKD